MINIILSNNKMCTTEDAENNKYDKIELLTLRKFTILYRTYQHYNI